MYKIYYYEDLFFKNMNLRDSILEEIKKYDTIEIRNLSSKDRHIIYKEMYFPLAFEKIEKNKHVYIVV